MIQPDLLKLLRCPENRTSLREAESSLIARLNEAVEARRLRNRGGELVERTLDGGLVREDGKFLYPIIDAIPVMMVDEAIPLDGFS